MRDFECVNYDDLEFVVENPNGATGLSRDNVRWALANPYGAAGGPVTWLSHMIDVELFGMDPGAHHLTSLALHGLDAVLLLIVLARITNAPGPSALVAALFAVHPLHVESVAWIAERKDVVRTLFWILAIGAYAGYVRRPGWRYGLVALPCCSDAVEADAGDAPTVPCRLTRSSKDSWRRPEDRVMAPHRGEDP